MMTQPPEIWIWVQHRDGEMEPQVPGLINEAKKIISTLDSNGRLTAILIGSDLEGIISKISNPGVDKIVYVDDSRLQHYHGEMAARLLFDMAKIHPPCAVLMAQNDQTEDLAPRLAALLQSALITQVMDVKMTSPKDATADRTISNGYLFETVSVDMEKPPIICFEPVVLTDPEPDFKSSAGTRIDAFSPPWPDYELKTRPLEVIESDAQDLSLEEADIIIAGGRGAGSKDDFKKLHDLAAALGGPVAGTRPVIDSDILPYERQIGQTGKTVSPKLLINIGISGANEYTAGIEKSKTIVAVNTDERARIFNYADIGLVGDAKQILDALMDRIQKVGP
jgi:electron transfer flavoprotein alpha subunit